MQVRNLIAEKDMSIQLGISENTRKDSFNVLLINVLTVLFLPGTFIGVNYAPSRLLFIIMFADFLADTSDHTDVRLVQYRRQSHCYASLQALLGIHWLIYCHFHHRDDNIQEPKIVFPSFD